MSYMSTGDENWAELSLSSLAYTSPVPVPPPPQLAGFSLFEFSHHCPRNHHPFSPPPPPPPLYAPNTIHTHLPPLGIPFTRRETTTNNGGGGGLTTATTFSHDQDESTKKRIRLMKNRESAVRSRARKQAYTSELEREVARLVKENDQLKKRLENGNGDENKQKSQMSAEVQLHYMKKKSQPQFQRAASAPL